jgi:hypothetical protein
MNTRHRLHPSIGLLPCPALPCRRPGSRIAPATALAAAFLNAAFGICLGCMLYPLAVRLRRTPAAQTPAT